jgi:hypothetical protein
MHVDSYLAVLGKQFGSTSLQQQLLLLLWQLNSYKTAAAAVVNLL